MAQTTAGKSFCAATIQLYTIGLGVYTLINGWANSLAEGGGDRAVAETHTGDGDTPIVTYAKRGAKTVTIRYVYTPGVGDPFQAARVAYEADCGEIVGVRWQLQGVGDIFTISGAITSFKFPEGDYSSADSVRGEFTVTGPSIASNM